MKKLFVVLALSVSVFVFGCSSGGGSDVPEGYIGIYTVEDLFAVADDNRRKYILMNDIDLTGTDWTPLFHYFMGFDGIFNVNNHKIMVMHTTPQ